ncbi:MAG TPA: phosphoglycerate kinase [Solirubrobacteraceae bacterium]|jgi:phosphoglycerate kinase|nr:phosphoglycerate kinase [Solirubrobacteraceae bacterium]
MKTLDDLQARGRRVLVRADLNVPLRDGRPSDDTRIRAALPTIRELRAAGAAIVLASHLGRPKGRDASLSLAPVAERLRELTGAPVTLAPGVVGVDVVEVAEKLGPGEILLLENLRYEPGETANDPALARALAELGDAYVNDAFGAAHRAHASTEGVARLLPAYGGRLLVREVQMLESILEQPQRPLVVVIGGAKVTDKIAVLERFMTLADVILIGGAMCFPFLAGEGRAVGASMCEEEGLEPARRILESAGAEGRARLRLPEDLVIADRFAADAERRELDGVDVPDGWMGLDVGPRTAAAYAKEIAAAGTVFWNGPMGAFELEPFSAGTRVVAEAVASSPATTVVGGGDSAAALVAFGLADRVTHLSTGGGATLELVEGRTLPGVRALQEN